MYKKLSDHRGKIIPGDLILKKRNRIRYKMYFKLTTIFLFIALAHARSLTGRINVQTQKGNIQVTNQNNERQVQILNNQLPGLTGQQTIEVQVSGEDVIPRTVQVINQQVNEKGVHQSDILSQIFAKNTGLLGESQYEKLLAIVAQHVENGQVDPLVLHALQVVSDNNQIAQTGLQLFNQITTGQQQGVYQNLANQQIANLLSQQGLIQPQVPGVAFAQQYPINQGQQSLLTRTQQNLLSQSQQQGLVSQFQGDVIPQQIQQALINQQVQQSLLNRQRAGQYGHVGALQGYSVLSGYPVSVSDNQAEDVAQLLGVGVYGQRQYGLGVPAQYSGVHGYGVASQLDEIYNPYAQNQYSSIADQAYRYGLGNQGLGYNRYLTQLQRNVPQIPQQYPVDEAVPVVVY